MEPISFEPSLWCFVSRDAQQRTGTGGMLSRLDAETRHGDTAARLAGLGQRTCSAHEESTMARKPPPLGFDGIAGFGNSGNRTAGVAGVALNYPKLSDVHMLNWMFMIFRCHARLPQGTCN